MSSPGHDRVRADLSREQMYKKRFHGWGVRKNYTRQQKADILQALSRKHDRDVIERTTIERKQIKLRRLRRPVREHGYNVQVDASTDVIDQNVRRLNVAELETMHIRLRSPHKFSRIQLQQSSEALSIEAMLFQVSRYYSSCNTQTKSTGIFYYGPDLGATREALVSGRHLLPSSPQQAFAMLNKACNALPSVLRVRPLKLLADLVLVFAEGTWLAMPEIKQAVLKYVSSLACSMFGAEDPLTRFVEFMSASDDLRPWILRFYNLSVDMAKSLLKQQPEDLLDMSLSLIPNNIDDNNLDEATNLCQKAHLHIQQTLPSTHRLSRRALEKLAWFHRRQGNLKNAESSYLKAIELAYEAYGGLRWDTEGLFACRGLAHLYAEMQRFEESEGYLRLAIEGGKGLGKAWDHYVVRYLRDLELVFEEQGRQHDIVLLRIEYAQQWEKFRRCELGGHSDQPLATVLSELHPITRQMLYESCPKLCTV